ncbi:hypothetical protein FNF27_00118 [Cafeteria roenbergensis]|uniref:Trafficking protein particle complex subunit n=1 Tax=Cafeteria roenbergensis TaxID=33653 RepID=A0A5A8DY52_CAFRO|nr:hypothetical protein FNF29_03429 [Cafeteria roenbergensis]KAA0164252.1 hypothetical protein FNF31_02488 [Cafeteria roenbergensis]KAA0168720.1 hypothetical protein FNF28_02457 [Cafeteria roenbergensis]KAA0178265.1 hypothetical protein FNF27_00118 [Cafeteria roenbergensis]|eukprot:KAA0152905.1 hypothetical protein FNF29_03429 [Cafeteria roenbergensis]
MAAAATSRLYYSVYVINKSGSISYERWVSPLPAPETTANDHIRMASTLHTVYNMAAQVAPEGTSGIREVRTSAVTIFTLPTPTGITFVVTAPPDTRVKVADAAVLFRRLYRSYADIILKDPFANPDQPIRSADFTAAVVDIMSGR